jgi:hypothetical protein
VSESDDLAMEGLHRHRAALARFVKQMALSLGAGKSPTFDATDVLKEIAAAASACADTITLFGDDDPFPVSVLKAIGETQDEIAHATNALVLMLATLRKQT